MGSENDSHTPPRKKQRMSSPTYDDQMDFPSQEQLKGVEELELSLSQVAGPSTQRWGGGGLDSGPGRLSQENGSDSTQETNGSPSRHPLPALSGFTSASSICRPAFSTTTPQSDPENPFIDENPVQPIFSTSLSFLTGRQALPSRDVARSSSPPNDDHAPGLDGTSTSTMPMPGFKSAASVTQQKSASLGTYLPSSSPEAPQEQVSGSVTGTTKTIIPLGFLSASASHGVLASGSGSHGTPLAFTSAGKGKVFAPSNAALREAEAKMRQWEEEEENMLKAPSCSPSLSPQKNSSVVVSPPRKILGSVHNNASDEPLASIPFAPSSTVKEVASFHTPVMTDLKGKMVARPFKSPLLPKTFVQSSKNTAYTNSPLNPNRTTLLALGSTPARGFRPLLPSTPATGASTPVLETPARQASTFTTPMKSGITPMRRGGTQKKFVTPFKAGMRPGEPDRGQLAEKYRQEQAAASSNVRIAASLIGRSAPAKPVRQKFFDMMPPPSRKTLMSSGLLPQQYTTEQLSNMEITVADIQQITVETAIYYSFNCPSASTQTEPQPTQLTLGPTLALGELLRLGCSLATQDWIDNHWRLILWKLAGMVCLDPEHESCDDGKRWSWNEVLRQLLYRYEKELNGGSRPALRLITTQDAPASLPMTLCISNIFWTEGGIGPDGFAILPHPELELTDGWYRLRAEVDEPLARAARKGHLQIGRKIGVAGAKLSTGRSEPCEVLEAYDSVHLTLMGNATHLAPWHAKLGFMPALPITTLNSLTQDGGFVQLADLVVTKVYPVAYIEFVEENGRQRREGPWKENEELKVHERWLARREREEDKLRQEIRSKHDIYNGWMDQLMRKSRGQFYPKEEDSPPGDLEDMFDQLVDGEDDINRLTSRLNPMDAGWMADFITSRIHKEQGEMDKEIERELKQICPPRNVRNFRILFMKDANTSRRPRTRTAEITVWDVLSINFDEGKPGHFKEGQRFLITNLMPTQQSAWMRHTDEDSHVYLCTRRNSRWTKL